MNNKTPPDTESLPASPKPRFLEGGGPLRLEDACCVLRHPLRGITTPSGSDQVPDDNANT